MSIGGTAPVVRVIRLVDAEPQRTVIPGAFTDGGCGSRSAGND